MPGSSGKIDGRRIRAAIAYAPISGEAIADQIGASVHTLYGWGKDGASLRMRQTRPALQRLAELAELPEAFFYADFNRLDELVPTDGRQPVTPRATDRAAAGRARQAAERRARPSDAERRQGPQDRRTGS
jgi:hypothetical protein